MSKKKKPILNLQKGCPFCGNTDLVSGYNPTQNETKIACTDCEYFITFKKAPPIYTPYLAEFVWNSRADEAKPTESTAEAILSELKDIKSYVAELAGYSLEK
jgi:transcription elongation factor Elf1|nr:MAG TPA: DNA-directed RNA polymerase [Caudoviricetes sp.]